MKKVYACLLGNWVCLNDDPECTIGNRGQSPSLWWEEGGGLHAPFQREKENTLHELNYVNLYYKGTEYRINPANLQIVTEKYQ